MIAPKGWGHLKWWESGECQAVLERLNDVRKAGQTHCPKREDLFKALQAVPAEDVRVAIIGQDPYPDPRFASGIAFSVPESIELHKLPPTLKTIFTEYCNDLHYSYPTNGSLLPWCKQGVLLWNAIPSCSAFLSLSHDWPEWSLLTQEVIQTLSRSGQTVFMFLGNTAKRFSGYVEPGEDCLVLSHPSPRASLRATRPFLGSRCFSTINDLLVNQGLSAIDWKL